LVIFIQEHRWLLPTVKGDKLRPFFEEVLNIDEIAQRAGQRPDGRKFFEVMHRYKVDEPAATNFTTEVAGRAINPAAGNFANRWLHAMSDTASSPTITLIILYRALLQKQDGVDTFSTPGVTRARRIAEQFIKLDIGDAEMKAYWGCLFNCIEGKIEQSLGNMDRAIEFLTRAVELEPIGKLEVHGMEVWQSFDIFAPWQYLAEVYKTRVLAGGTAQDLLAYQKYINHGCKKDDPVSHWQAAEYAKEYKDGHHVATSKWMYHCLKAAASGHLQAAYSLANFYRDNGWRYLEDDPPDEVKPTPFDHEPPETAPDIPRGFFGDIREFLRRIFTDAAGIGKFPRIEEQHEALFYTAVYPSTAEERIRLALEWLDVASDFNFAPAYLVKARIHLEKTLWIQATAPASALALSDTRYGKVEDGAADSEDGPKNPHHSISLAKDALREVFRACRMGEKLRHRDAIFQRGAGKIFTYDRIRHDIGVYHEAERESPEIAKFFEFSYVWDQFADDLERMEREAKHLCQKHKLDIYETDGMLVFKGTA
jgi:hypothetical protein